MSLVSRYCFNLLEIAKYDIAESWVMKSSHFWSDQWSTGVLYGRIPIGNHVLFETFFDTPPVSPQDVLASSYEASTTPNTLVSYHLPRTRLLDTFRMKTQNNKCCHVWSNMAIFDQETFCSGGALETTTFTSKTTDGGL